MPIPRAIAAPPTNSMIPAHHGSVPTGCRYEATGQPNRCEVPCKKNRNPVTTRNADKVIGVSAVSLFSISAGAMCLTIGPWSALFLSTLR
ncbi:Uncharacterised protein [Mycobacteroides abscessus subsp. abscessus]|nr:Uncharacterised protein [Mycobacteroides abscessus subsp. abscessus]